MCEGKAGMMKKNGNNEKMAYEEYRLVFTHTYIDGDGERTVLEDPIKVVHVFPTGENRTILPVSVCLNDMLERMKDYILRESRRMMAEE